VIRLAQLRGYLLEEALAWLLRNAGYRLLVDKRQDEEELIRHGNGLCVRGRGADHQVDVLGEFAFTPAFSLPIRLFLEAKFTEQKTGLPVVRNAHSVIHDINENFAHGRGKRLRKRFRYVYAIFSAKGFTREAQDFALAQQISLVDLSGTSFDWLRHAVEAAAFELYESQELHQIQRFPLNWMREQLRSRLGTLPALADGSYSSRLVETEADRFADHARQILDMLTQTLQSRSETELLLGFPAAPFVLPLASDDVTQFLNYARVLPDHRVRLRPAGQGAHVEWRVSPAELQDPTGQSLGGYELAFNLPDHLETWINEQDEHRSSRTRAVKQQFLSDIVVYRMEGDRLQTFQLHYQPGELKRGRRSDG
jgi:Restriction endonuclease